MPGQFDYSLYPQAQPPINPLAIGGEAAGLVNTLNQNRLFQQTFAARSALGPLYQQSIDPSTGQLDTNKLTKLVSTDPRTAFMAPDILAGILQRKASEVTIASGQQDLATKYTQAAGMVLSPLLTKRDKKTGALMATPKDALDALSDAFTHGQLPAEVAMNWVRTIPTDSKQFEDWLVQNGAVMPLSPQERLAATMGTPTAQQTGAGTQFVSVSPVTGVRPTSGGFIPSQEMTEVPDPSDPTRKITMTKAQAAAMVGGGGGGGGAGSSRPLNAGGASPGARVPGPIVGASPGEAAAQQKAKEESGKSLAELRSLVDTSGPRMFQLKQALNALGRANTGPGSSVVNTGQSFMLAHLPLIARTFGADPQKVKNYDEAQKYLTQYSMAQAGSLGAGTDEKLATALTANASTHISNLAAQDVVRANIGLERYQQAQLQAFEATGVPESEFGSWAAKWSRDIDARVFVADLLNVAQRKTMLGDMSKTEKDKFYKSRDQVMQMGVLQ